MSPTTSVAPDWPEEAGRRTGLCTDSMELFSGGALCYMQQLQSQFRTSGELWVMGERS